MGPRRRRRLLVGPERLEILPRALLALNDAGVVEASLAEGPRRLQVMRRLLGPLLNELQYRHFK